MHEKLTMTTICDGAVQEKVDRALTVQEHQKGMIKGQLDFGDLADLYGELDEEGGTDEFDPEEGLETVPYGDVLDFQRAQGER